MPTTHNQSLRDTVVRSQYPFLVCLESSACWKRFTSERSLAAHANWYLSTSSRSHSLGKAHFPLFPPRASTTCILAQGEAGLSVRRLHPNRFASGNRTWPDFSFFIPNKIYDVYCLGVGVLNVIANVPLVPRRIKFPPKSASSERA